MYVLVISPKDDSSQRVFVPLFKRNPEQRPEVVQSSISRSSDNFYSPHKNEMKIMLKVESMFQKQIHSESDQFYRDEIKENM